jgi:hypothetical protein
VAIIEAKRPYANRNHGAKRLGANPLNEWFDDPVGLLAELQRSGFIVAGKPEVSPFFQLTSFNGPMFKVFTDDELRTLQDWTRSLRPDPERLAKDDASGAPQPARKDDPGVAMARLLDALRERQVGAQGHGVLLEGPDPVSGERVARPLSFWFHKPEGEGEASASTLRLMAVLRDPKNGWVVPFDVAQSPLVTRMASGNGAMSRALQAPWPTATDRSYRDVIVDWIKAGCPLPEETIAPPGRRLRAMVAEVAGAEKRAIRGKLFLH